MLDFLSSPPFFLILYGVYVWLVGFTPIFILNIQTNKLYKKNLKMLLDSKNDDQKRLEEEKNKNNSILVDAIKGLDKEIKDLKENRNTVLKLIAKYQDNNKNYRGVLKIWKEFLSNLREYNGARFNGLVAMYEIMSEERQIELRNKLLAGEKILKEISSSIFI